MSISNKAVITQHTSGMSETRKDMIAALKRGEEVLKVNVTVPMVVLSASERGVESRDTEHTFKGVMYNRDGESIALVKDEFDYYQDVEIDVKKLDKKVEITGKALEEDVDHRIAHARMKAEAAERKKVIEKEKLAQKNEEKAKKVIIELGTASEALREAYASLEDALGHGLSKDDRLAKLDALYKKGNVKDLVSHNTSTLISIAKRDAVRMDKLARLVNEQRLALASFNDITDLGKEGMSLDGESYHKLTADLRRNQMIIEDGFLLETGYDVDKEGVRVTLKGQDLSEKASFLIEGADYEEYVEIEIEDGMSEPENVGVNAKVITLDSDASNEILPFVDKHNRFSVALYDVLQKISEDGITFMRDFDDDVDGYGEEVKAALSVEMEMSIIDVSQEGNSHYELIKILRQDYPKDLEELSTFCRGAERNLSNINTSRHEYEKSIEP